MNKLTKAIKAVDKAYQEQFGKPIKRKLAMEACMRKGFLVINNGNVHRDDWANGPHLPEIRVNRQRGILVIISNRINRYMFTITRDGEVKAILTSVPTIGSLTPVEDMIVLNFTNAKLLDWE